MKKYKNFLPIKNNLQKKSVEQESIKKLIKMFLLLNLALFSFILINYGEKGDKDIPVIKDSKVSSYESILNYVALGNNICYGMSIENGVGTIIISNFEYLNKIPTTYNYTVKRRDDGKYEVKIE